MDHQSFRIRSSAWMLAILVLCCTELLHAATPVLDTRKTTVALNGTWTLTTSGGTQPFQVPGAIPFTFGISTWARTFTLNLSTAPVVAFLEFDGIAHTAVVRLNGIQVGRLVALMHTRLDVRSALVLQGTNRLELEIDDRLTEYTVPGGATDLVSAGLRRYRLYDSRRMGALAGNRA